MTLDMPMEILPECTNCAACEEDCPTQAITRGVDMFVIDANQCNDCHGTYAVPQCIELCPLDCIAPRGT